MTLIQVLIGILITFILPGGQVKKKITMVQVWAWQDPEQYANMLDLSLLNAHKKFLHMWDFYLLNQSFNFKLVRFVDA